MTIAFQKEQALELMKRCAAAASLEQPWSAPERRSGPRVLYLRCNIAMRLKHPTGDERSGYILSRNLGSGGMAAMHRGFLHPGTIVALDLKPREGHDIAVVGDILECRFVEGQIHESNIAFRSKIDPMRMLSLRELEAREASHGDTPAETRARVLCVGVDEYSVSGLTGALGKVPVETAPSLVAAVSLLQKGTFDAVVCGELLDDSERTGLASWLRANGRHAGPILLAGWSRRAAEAAASEDPNGATRRCDPFDRDSVLAAMSDRVRAAAA